MHEIGVETSQFEAIKNGDKTIEGRLGEPRILKIQPEDTLTIHEDIIVDGKVIGSHDEKIQTTVTQVLYFESFEEMLETVDYTVLAPEAESIDDALAAYTFLYSEKDEEEYGAVAIYIKVVE